MAVVSGRLQIRSYTDKDGNNRRAAEIVADNVYFGDSKQAASEAAVTPAVYAPASQFTMLEDTDSMLPF
jgi:single-strand DNA-binding protein